MIKNFTRVLSAILVIALIVIYIFFHKCEIDLYACICGCAVGVVGFVSTFKRKKKTEEIQEE